MEGLEIHNKQVRTNVKKEILQVQKDLLLCFILKLESFVVCKLSVTLVLVGYPSYWFTWRLRPKHTEKTHTQLGPVCFSHVHITHTQTDRDCSTELTVMIFPSLDWFLSQCGSGWGVPTSSGCELNVVKPSDTGAYWCESRHRDSSNIINITVTRKIIRTNTLSFLFIIIILSLCFSSSRLSFFVIRASVRTLACSEPRPSTSAVTQFHH